MYRLHVAIALTYIEGQLTYLSEPNAPHKEPIKEMMTIDLPNGDLYHYRAMFFREHCSQEIWRPIRMQLTAVSPVVLLSMLEFVPDKGVFCQGPSDPWNYANRVASLLPHAIYWIPCTIYNCVSPSACHTLRAQASTCPPWAFSTLKYNCGVFYLLPVDCRTPLECLFHFIMM